MGGEEDCAEKIHMVEPIVEGVYLEDGQAFLAEETVSDSDYSFIEDIEESCTYEEQTRWLDIQQPIANRSDSNDSSWEVLSLASSIDAISLCSVNDIAKRAIEEHFLKESM